MEQEYLYHLLLDCFKQNIPVKSNSLYHILTGKRTISVFLMAMRKGLTGAFQMMPKLSVEKLESFISNAQAAGELSNTDEGYLLTDKGQDRLENYFQNGYPRMNQHSQIRYARILPLFQKRVLFLTQVLSFSRHQIKDYIPLEQRFTEQQFIKKLLQTENEEKQSLGKTFGKQWMSVMECLAYPDVFMEQLEGFQTHRSTATQVASKQQIPVAVIEMMWHQDWLRVMEWSSTNNLFGTILNSLQQDAGLCAPSVQETYRFLEKDQTIQSIARKRNLKESTIADHITEMALLQPEFPFELFLSEELLSYAKDIHKDEVPFIEEVRTLFPTASFFETRLLQVKLEVERLWNER